ncbi:glycosyltransferase [Acinetobacter ursingii]|uniref:glycosyltransferase n=1 Tax=Acinetobacter ursingii TaxID=108980 RepID=UPI0032B51566
MSVSFIILADDGGGGPQSTKDIISSLELYQVNANYYVFRKNSGIIGLFVDVYNLLKYLWILDNKSIVFNSAGLFTGLLLSFFLCLTNIFAKKIRLIQIFHNRVKRDDKGFLHNLCRQFILEIILLSSSRFVSVSKGVGNEICSQTWFSTRKLQRYGLTIYNPTRKLESDHINSNPYEFDGKVILGIGRLCAQKDFGSLIEAHSIFSKIDPTCNLVIVGEGEDKDYLQKLASHSNNPDRIHFWGYDTDIAKHYKYADVFILSSIHEGFGLVLVEAMNAKLPVISTNCPYGPEEILDYGKYGKIVNVGDSQAMSDAVQNLFEIKKFEKDLIIDSAYSRSLEFSPSSIGKQYKDLIDSL